MTSVLLLATTNPETMSDGKGFLYVIIFLVVGFIVLIGMAIFGVLYAAFKFASSSPQHFFIALGALGGFIFLLRLGGSGSSDSSGGSDVHQVSGDEYFSYKNVEERRRRGY